MSQSTAQPVVSKTLMQLCYPLFLHSVLSFAVVLLDTMIISAYSADAAAAVNIANQILLVFYEFSALLGVGGVIIIAHSLGRGDEARAKEVAKVTVLANALFSGLMSLLLLLLAPFLLRWINTPAVIYDDALLYVYICGVSLTLNGFMMAALSCLRGFGLTKIIFVMSVFSQSFYLVLEYVLILGWGPIEGMGVYGSALGTLTLRLVACSLLVIILIRSLKLKNDVKHTWKSLKELIKRLFNLSFPSVSDNIAYGLYQWVIISFIAGLGVATVLSRGYTMIATTFLTLVIMVVSQGNEVLLGYRSGEGDIDGVYRRAIRSAWVAIILATGLAVIIYALAEPFIGLFSDDPEVLAISKQLLFYTIFLQPVFALNAILFHSLKAVGDVNWPVIVSQIITWCLSLPLAYVVCVEWEYGVVGVWWVLIAEESIKSALMLYRWNARHWLNYSVA